MTTIPASLTQIRQEQEARTRPLDLRLMRRLFEYTRPFARRRNRLFLLVLARSIQLPLLALLMGWIIRGPIEDGDFSKTLNWTAGFLALAILTQWTLVHRQRLSLELGEAVIHDLRRDLFHHIQRMPMSFFNRMKLGRIISRFSSDAEAVRLGVQDVVFAGVVQVGMMIVSAILMLSVDGVLFCIVACLAPVLWGINRAFRLKFAQVHRAVQESMSRVTANVAESVSGIRVTQGFARQDVNADLFGDLTFDHGEMGMAATRINGLFNPLLNLNRQLFIASLLVVGGYRVMDPQIHAPVGDLITFFFLANTFFGPIQQLGLLYTQAMTSMAGAERVFALLDTPPVWRDPPDPIALPPIEGRVEFREVSFAYVPDRPVLKDLSFTAQPGQSIALVGQTGSGKSSIIHLISKFYLPTTGEVLIDGHDLMKIRSESLHRQMGIVLQVNFLFTGTIMDNIRIGRPEATDEQVVEAARRLDCLDLLESLPEGLFTPVGERGGSLSLGQRQLVCFTRALLADPRILILDEATSSVDTVTEHRIQKALKVLLEGRTSFVVAHRLSTVRHADQVLVLQDGEIVERGAHLELLSEGGIYADLYRQFVDSSEG